MKKIELISGYNENDVNSVVEALYPDENAVNYINKYVPPGLGRPDKEQMRGYITQKNNGGIFARNKTNIWLIKELNENVFIGFVVFGNFIPTQPDSIGLTIAEKYSGKGYGKESLAQLLEVLRKENIQTAYGYCQSDNAAIIKIMESLDFKRDEDYNEMQNVNKYILTL